MRTVVHTPRGEIAAYVAHLPSVRIRASGLASSWRDESAGLLGKALAAEQLKTVVLLGDLNGTVDDRGLAPLTSRMNVAQRGFAFSFPAAFPLARIDQVMARSAAVAHIRTLPATGSFIVIDRVSDVTVGAGMIQHAERTAVPDRATNVTWHQTHVDKAARAAQKNQTPRVLWFTGLSGAGKSTIANALEQKLVAMGHHTYLLDGDNVRHGLNRDLGFNDQDRVENIRRVGEVAKLFVDAGLVVVTAFISPFRSDRQLVRDMFDEGEFVEVFVDTPLELAEQRDPKGLYAKARTGQIKNFTGIDSPYERPQRPDVHLDTEGMSVEQCVEALVRRLGGAD
jgi:adenylyl-sulfate kinase